MLVKNACWRKTFILVKNFHHHSTPKYHDVGKNVGFISAMFQLGQLITCFLWGYLINKIGYKKCAILASLGQILKSDWPSYWWV